MVSSPSPGPDLFPQMTARRKPHQESKKLIDRIRIAIMVTVMTPIPITFHSVSSAGGVAEASPTHPVVTGLEEREGMLLESSERTGGESVCTTKAVSILDSVAAAGVEEAAIALVSTKDVRSRLVSMEETVGVCGKVRVLGDSASGGFPPTNRPIRSRSSIGRIKSGLAIVKVDRPMSHEYASKV
jgi:hypothetical protein